jgi:hypothetical protein
VRTIAFAAALAVGAAIRLVGLPLPGSTDVRYFVVWAHYAAQDDPAAIYGRGGGFGERRLLHLDGVATKVNYPPLAVYELRLAGRWVGHVRLAIKVLTVLAEVATAALIVVAVLRWTGTADRAAWAAVSLWVNPACLLIASVLGYVDPLFALPAAGAVIAAASGRPLAAGALLAAAFLTKQLAIIAVPAVVLAIVNAGDAARAHRRLIAASGAAAIATAVIVAPVAWHGGLVSLVWALGAPLRDPFLSGNAVGVWALVPSIVPAIPVDAARVVGALLTVAAIGWGVVQVRHTRDLWLIAGLAAFSFHAYATLAVAVHENHAYFAVPMLALAAAGRPELRGLFVALSTIVASNLYFAYGVGVDVAHQPPETIGRLDPLIWLTAVNIAVFAWFARVLRVAGRSVGSGDHDCRA